MVSSYTLLIQYKRNFSTKGIAITTLTKGALLYFLLLTLTFCILFFAPYFIHIESVPKLLNRSGIVISQHPYETNLYPNITAIDYQKFVHE
jgi:hypothetical protein